MKRYFADKFLENLREIVFLNCLNYNYVNNSYSNFIYRCEEAINFIAPAKRIRQGFENQLFQQYKDVISYLKNKLFKLVKSSSVLALTPIRTILKLLKYACKKWSKTIKKLIRKVKKNKSYFEEELAKKD